MNNDNDNNDNDNNTKYGFWEFMNDNFLLIVLLGICLISLAPDIIKAIKN